MGKIAFLIFPIALVLYEIIVYLSNDMNLPSLPSLEKDFNTTREMTQYTLLTWFLGSASLQLVMGPLADRFGRRIVLLVGGLFFIISTIFCASTHNITIMLIARFVQGTAVCSVLVAGYAAIHELYESKTAIQVITIMGAATFLAPAFGPIIGAFIIELSNWRAIFWLLAFLAILVISLLFKTMPETNKESVPIRLKSIYSDYKSIIFNRSFMRFAFPFWLIDMAMIVWIVESPYLIIETYQQSVITFGVIQLLVFGCFIIGAQITNVLINKMQSIKIIEAGLTISLLGVALLFIAALLYTQLWFVTVSLMIISMGSAMSLGPLNRLAIEASQAPMGSRTAIFSAIMGLFGVIATLLVSLLSEMNAQNLALLIGPAMIFALLLFKILHQKTTAIPV